MNAPQSLMGPMPEAQMTQAVTASPLTATYGQAVDRESAYEMLAARVSGAVEAHGGSPTDAASSSTPAPAPVPAPQAPAGGPQPIPVPQDDPEPRRHTRAEKEEPGMLEQVMDNPMMRSMLRSAGTTLGREITRSLFGTARRRR